MADTDVPLLIGIEPPDTFTDLELFTQFTEILNALNNIIGYCQQIEQRIQALETP